jgi:hypothetical protein
VSPLLFVAVRLVAAATVLKPSLRPRLRAWDLVRDQSEAETDGRGRPSGYSFSPDSAIPRTKARWKNRKMSAVGIMAITAMAMIS